MREITMTKELTIPPKDQKRIDEIFLLIEQGVAFRNACKQLAMSPNTFYKHLLGNREMEKQYAQACLVRANLMADEMLEIADNEPDPQRARVRVDTRKWLLSKLNPKRFGDKVSLEHSGDVGIKHVITVVPVAVKSEDDGMKVINEGSEDD